MSADDDFAAETIAAVRQAPASGGIRITDPGDSTITKRAAQKLFLDGMAVVMEEWHGRGAAEGRLRERERIASILTHRAALGRRPLAEQIAFGGDTAADQAIAELESAPAEKIV